MDLKIVANILKVGGVVLTAAGGIASIFVTRDDIVMKTAEKLAEQAIAAAMADPAGVVETVVKEVM